MRLTFLHIPVFICLPQKIGLFSGHVARVNDGKHHNQIDYILVKERFRSGVSIHRTRSFPGADIGSGHNLEVMTFRVRLKKARKPNQPRLRFDLEELRDPDVARTFQAMIGGKFAPLTELSDEDMDIDTMITTYNTAVTDAASEILGKERRRKKTWRRLNAIMFFLHFFKKTEKMGFKVCNP